MPNMLFVISFRQSYGKYRASPVLRQIIFRNRILVTKSLSSVEKYIIAGYRRSA